MGTYLGVGYHRSLHESRNWSEVASPCGRFSFYYPTTLERTAAVRAPIRSVERPRLRGGGKAMRKPSKLSILPLLAPLAAAAQIAPITNTPVPLSKALIFP